MFKHLGGQVDEGSCQQVSVDQWCSAVNADYGEILKCNCVAPGPDAFSLHYLEIGAADGVYLSNTMFFDSQLGYVGNRTLDPYS